MKVKDSMTIRDLIERSKIASMSEKENKKTTDEDLEKLDHRVMSGQRHYNSAQECGAWDALGSISSAAAASSSSGIADDLGSFGSLGRAVAAIGDVRELMPPPQTDKQSEDGEAATKEEGGTAEPGPAASAAAKQDGADPAPGRKGTPSSAWHGRDEKIMTELTNHKGWLQDTRADLISARDLLTNMRLSVEQHIVHEVRAELNLVTTRERAINLAGRK